MKKQLAPAQSADRKRNIHLLVALAMYLLLRFCVLKASETTGLTELGVKALSVFIPVCYLWCVIDVLWPSLAAVVLLAIDGATTAPTAFQTVFGHYFVAQTVCMSLVVATMLRTGLLGRVARWIISRPVLHGRPYLFLAFFGVATWFIAVCTGYINAAIIMLALGREVSASINIDKNHSFHKSILMVIMASAIMGESSWPFGKAVCTIAFSQLTALGVECSQMDFLAVGLPFSALALALIPFMLKWIVKPDVDPFDNFDDAAVREQLKSKPFSREEMAIAVLFVFNYASYILVSIFPQVGFLTRLGTGGVALTTCCIGGLIKVEGVPLLDWQNGFNRAPWRSALYLGSCFVFVNFCTSADYGISKFFAYLLKPITSGLPPIALICVTLLLTTILTNFMSNAVVCVAAFAVCMPTLIASGVPNGYLVITGILICFMANSGICTPAGSSCTAYITGPDSDITVAEGLKFNVAMAVCYVILGCVVLLPYGIAIFN